MTRGLTVETQSTFTTISFITEHNSTHIIQKEQRNPDGHPCSPNTMEYTRDVLQALTETILNMLVYLQKGFTIVNNDLTVVVVFAVAYLPNDITE